MRVLEIGREGASPVERFESRGAFSRHLGSGAGAAHVYAVHLDPGGEIGPHEAGFDQLFVVVAGSGWAAGPDGVRHPIAEGQAARFTRGEVHSKGSDAGMRALMIQVESLDDPEATERR